MVGIYSLFVLLTSIVAASDAFRVGRRQRNTTSVGDLEEGARQQPKIFPALTGDQGASDIDDLCTCSFGMYAWQQWPLSRGGYGCIGGCGGNEFQIDHYGSVIKTFTVWFKNGNWNDYLRAIRVTYEDGHAEEVGGREGSPASFTFQVGEWIVGDLRLSGNGVGTRTGSIAFDTNLGRHFDVGRRDPTRFYFATGGTLSRPVHMAGLSGAAGSDIDRLGVIFWKPISDTSYLSINYPTLSSVGRLTSPTEIRSRSFCNDGPHDLPATERILREVVTVGSETCLTTSLETQFSFGITITGSVPFIKEASATAEWSLTAAIGTKNCWTETSTRNETLRFPSFQIPPYTRVRQTFSQWSGSLASLPYNAVLRVTMTDGTTFQRNIDGFYRGVSYNDVHLAYHTDSDVTEC